MLGIDNIIGSLTKGMIANFIITSKNIFEKPRDVMDLQIAKKMLKKKEPIEKVVEYTGLTEYQVEGLKRKVR